MRRGARACQQRLHFVHSGFHVKTFLQIQWLLFRCVCRHSRREQYLDAISVALLWWSEFHDALPACANVVGKLETTLSESATMATMDLHAERVAHFRNLYSCVKPTSNVVTNHDDPNMAPVLPWRVLARLSTLIRHLDTAPTLGLVVRT